MKEISSLPFLTRDSEKSLSMAVTLGHSADLNPLEKHRRGDINIFTRRVNWELVFEAIRLSFAVLSIVCTNTKDLPS